MFDWSFDRFQEWVFRKSFGKSDRIELYESLMILIEGGVKLDDALKKMYAGYSHNGKNPRHPMAIIISECIAVVGNGKRLSLALENWVPEQEVALLRAGEESGKTIFALEECVKLVTVKDRIMSSIVKAVSYPSILLCLSCVTLYIVATKVMPKMLKISDPNNWGFSASVLQFLSNAVTEYGLYCLAVLIMVIIWVIYFMRSESTVLRGDLRVFLDNLPPWSLYRLLQGSVFLLNLSLLLKAGVQLKDSLDLLSANASPWLKQRIEAISVGVGNGKFLGYAMDLAGYQFPDKKAIMFLSILSEVDGLEEVLYQFSMRWMEKSVKSVDAIANRLLVMGMVIFGLLMAIILAGSSDMSDAIRS